MDKWKFAVDNEDLINLVLLGKKIATTSLFKGKIEPIGEKSLILDILRNSIKVQNCKENR